MASNNDAGEAGEEVPSRMDSPNEIEYDFPASCSSSVTFTNQTLSAATIEQLEIFRRDLLLCDVHLQTDDGRCVSAHRLVLAAAIPYFRSLFVRQWKDSKEETIKIQGISFEALNELVDFVYSNKIVINNDNVQTLLRSASFLQMDYVITACQDYLSNQLTVENCLPLRKFAVKYDCASLKDEADKFASDNFLAMCRLPGFYDISFSHLYDLLKRPDLKVRSEDEVFDAIVAWIEHDKSNREAHFSALFSQVRLLQLSMPFLRDVVRTHPLVLECNESAHLLTNAILDRLATPNNSSGSAFSLAMEQKSLSQENADQYKVGTNDNRVTNVPINIPQLEPRKSIAGVIFCAGGRGTAGDPFRSVEAFCLRLNKWFGVADMLQQRRHVGLACARGKLFAIGGHNGVSHLATAEVLDPDVGSWRMVAPMNFNRRGIAVASIENAIYAIGGLDDTTCFNAVERYDVENDQWKLVAVMNVKRGGVGLAVLNNCLYAVGGNDGTSSLDSCEKYCPFTDKWTMIAPMKNRRAGAGVCELGGYLIAAGGFDDNAPLSTCEKYDPYKNEWTQIQSMSCARGGVGVSSMAGYVYAIGGHDGNQYLNTVERYNPQTDTWTPVAEIKECRAGAGVVWGNCWMDDFLRNSNDYKLRSKNTDF